MIYLFWGNLYYFFQMTSSLEMKITPCIKSINPLLGITLHYNNVVFIICGQLLFNLLKSLHKSDKILSKPRILSLTQLF